MILGVGSDILKNSRIERLLNIYRDRFLKRIFTPLEISFIESLNNNKQIFYISKRYAAKEAFSKAIGTGIGGELSFQDIEILSEKNGKPYFKLSDLLQKKLQSIYGQVVAHLSMSDEEEYSQAFVVIEVLS